ncbi:hypothetical protein SEPCBS119000_005742 [Sporothrix epigloea]|uniref:3-phytase n=1 Tax=Sporothrix epigloea TaxID=1892477 RepID=A0ABP0E293_9PEZI
MAGFVTSLADRVRTLLDGRRHHYEAVPSRVQDYGDEDEDYDYNTGSFRDENDRRRRRISASVYGTTTAGSRRGREPLSYREHSQSRRRRPARLNSSFSDGVLDSVWARGNRRFLRWTLLATTAVVLIYLGVLFSRITLATLRRGHRPPSCDTVDHGYQCYPQVAQNWGQYAPFFSVPSELKASEATALAPGAAPDDQAYLPSGCRFTFAQVLSRHGGRDPTSGRSTAYAALVARILANVPTFEDGPDGDFSFLSDYTYRMGADELTRFGELQLEHSGQHFYRRYRSLVQALSAEAEKTKAGGHVDPFVRSADQHRVVLSAIHWIQGFQAARRSDRAVPNKHSDSETKHIVLLPEAAGFNNTLSYNGLCKKFSAHAGTVAQQTFADTFVPAITARLNRGLPGANVSDTETIYLMDLCPFETIADEKIEGASTTQAVVGGGRRLSPFCHLFTEAEWRDYDYYQTLGKWYGFGDGSALGATQGVGFVNELLARLTESPVDDHTSTNRTMTADPATFPLDAHIYADFSHDNDMANIFAALGLYNTTNTRTTPPSNTTRTEPADLQGYAASWTVPFAARMYVEKMACDADEAGEEYVRILVNDRIMPLAACGSDQYGRCRLSRFVDSLAFARSGGHWDDCFA